MIQNCQNSVNFMNLDIVQQESFDDATKVK
jgi:hypothetical protein